MESPQRGTSEDLKRIARPEGTRPNYQTSNLSSVESINKNNPLNYDNQFAHTFYEYKIKKILTDIALGMTPAKVWNGIYNATGGFLIVKGKRRCFVLPYL